MQYNYLKLKGKIVEKFGTVSGYAEAMGISKGTASMKLSGKVGFSRDDIEKSMKLLDISADEISDYFFA